MIFPFVPKSTAHLQQGHYWCFPLSNGNYACGLVLARAVIGGKLQRSMFLGGLLDWSGSSLPPPAEQKDAKLLEYGFMHVKAIELNGMEVLGKFHIDLTTPPEVEYTGLTVDGPPLWGVRYVRALAEAKFGKADWSDLELRKFSTK